MVSRRRLSTGATLLAIPLLLTGCLDYSEQLQLQRDGSGTLGIDFTIDMSFMEDIARAIGDNPDPEEMRGPTREEVMAGLEVEGIDVQELEIQSRDKRTRVHIVLGFDSLETLTQIEGFGDDRRIEFFEDPTGGVRMIYSFDTTDVIPLEEVSDEEAAEAMQDPIERQIIEVTRRARNNLRFRSRIAMPGRILNSNGGRDREDPMAALWRIDRERTPERHAELGRGKIRMSVVVAREDLPFLEDRDIRPMPEGEGD
jgi:hypothetical protein